MLPISFPKRVTSFHPSNPTQAYWLAPLFNVILLAFIARDMAQLTWQLLWPEGTELSTTLLNPTPPQTERKVHSSSNPGSLRLFGEKITQTRSPTHKPVQPQVRMITLSLLGIFFIDGPDSLALIGQQGKREKAYRKGDTLPGAATLTDIYPDRIRFKRAGLYKTLMLPRGRNLLKGGSSTLSAKTNLEVKKIWETFSKRPESILKNIRLEPTTINGNFVGVRIYPGRKRSFLKQFGLRGGDLVTWVNGVALTDPLKGLALLGQLSTTDALHFRVQRGDATLSFDFFRNGPPPPKQ